MGKLIVPILVSFLLGLSGGGFYSVHQVSALHASAVAVARQRGIAPDSAAAAHDSTVSDSTPHVDERAATPVPPDATAATHDTTPAVVATASPVKPLPDTAHKPAVPSIVPVKAATIAHAVPAATTPASDAPTAAETAAHQRRLAKIFSTMGAKDAARVLAQMNDHDVSVILNLLGDRQAAAILINLPAPRAALLTQMPRRGGGDE